MAAPEYFQGAEFDWLERQVRSTCWCPGLPDAKPTLNQLYGVDAYSKARQAKRKSLPPKASMTVEELNAWRGSHPQRAKAVPYVTQTYPVMLYRRSYDVRAACSSHETKVVENAKDHQSALRAGWQDADAFYKKP